MKLACLLLATVVASVSAFGVVFPQQSLGGAVSITRTAFVPKPSVIRLFDKKDEDEEDPLLDDIVEDDEWMKLTIELTDAVYGEVKRVVDRVLDEEDKKKIEASGREIEVFVKGEVEKLRTDSKADMSKLTTSLSSKIETEVQSVTGDKDFKLEDYTKEAEARIMSGITDFAVGKATLEGLKDEIASRVEDRVQEEKDKAGYEFWKFKKALEREQDKKLKKVLAVKEDKGFLDFFSKLFGG